MAENKIYTITALDMVEAEKAVAAAIRLSAGMITEQQFFAEIDNTRQIVHHVEIIEPDYTVRPQRATQELFLDNTVGGVPVTDDIKLLPYFEVDND